MESKTPIRQEIVGNKKISKIVLRGFNVKTDSYKVTTLKEDFRRANRELNDLVFRYDLSLNGKSNPNNSNNGASKETLNKCNSVIFEIGALGIMLAHSNWYLGETVTIKVEPGHRDSVLSRIERFNSAISNMQEIDIVQNTETLRAFQNIKKYFENAEFLE